MADYQKKAKIFWKTLKDFTKETLRIQMAKLLVANPKSILEGFYHKKSHLMEIIITAIKSQCNQNNPRKIRTEYKGK